VALLGVTAMVVAMLSDGGYAVLTGRAGTLLARRHVRRLSMAGGICLIGGGVWLALMRAR
jgi:homoserine/homoserine lactone efflux protein